MAQTIYHVIIPSLRPTIQFVVVTTTIGLLTGMFGLLFVMTAGGPSDSTYLPELYIWVKQGRDNRPALASAAASMVLFRTHGRHCRRADPAFQGRRPVSAVTGLPRRTLIERARRAPRWFTAVVMSMIAVGTIYPLVFVLNVSLKDKRSYILDRFGVTDVPQGELRRCLAPQQPQPLHDQLDDRHCRQRCRAASVGLVGRLRLRPAVVQDQQLGVPRLPRRADDPVPGDHGAIRAHDARHRLHQHVLGLILAYTSIFLPFTVYLMASFYRRIPRTITEAATIDGASVWDTYRRIILPIGKPALLSVGILNALFIWNDVLVSLLAMPQEEKRTLMIGVSALRGQYSSNVPVSPPAC